MSSGTKLLGSVVAVGLLVTGSLSACSSGSGGSTSGSTGASGSGTATTSGGSGATGGSTGGSTGGGCQLTGTYTDVHVGQGGVTLAIGVCGSGNAYVLDRTGGAVPSAHVEGTFIYDADAGQVVVTNTSATTTDPNFDSCIGVPGTYHLAFGDCSQFTMTLVSDACAVRVHSIGTGATLTSGPLGNGESCSASGLTWDGGAPYGADGG